MIVSLELLLNDNKFEGQWRKKQVIDNLINIVLDEAHVVKGWGGTFERNYTKLEPLCYWFPWMILYHAESATVSNEMELELVRLAAVWFSLGSGTF